MSVIQTIRNKYIGFVIVAIIIALIGFLIMDAMQSNVRSIFSGDQTLLADVNGNRIEYKKFEALRQKYEENMKARSKDGNLSDQERSQVQDQVWNDIVNETLMGEEMEKLGIDLTDKELQDIESGPFPDPMIKQNFTDPNTGMFDPSRVSQYITQIGQDKTGKAREEWRAFEEQLVKTRKMTKYNELISKGIYVPKFVLDNFETNRSSQAAISYVQLPYNLISDSTIKVSDDEIKAFMQKKESLMKSQDATAKIEYVAFDIIPTNEDTAASLGVLNSLKAEFDTTKNNEEFIGANSEETMKNFYYTAANLEAPDPAAIVASGVGSVTGPFFFNGVFKMVKVVDKKMMPDSVSASHILIAINEQRNEEQAKASIDSIETMVKGGANFAQLAAQRSDDQGSATKGGELGYFAQGMMVPEFNDACFDGKTGDLKVVKTQYGYHLIKVTDQKDFKPAVKLAIVAKSLVPSNATTQAVYAKASEFSALAKDEKTFTDAAKKMGKDKRTADNMTKVQQQIPGLGSARELSRWAFNSKIGSISPIYNLDDKCVVAVLVSRQEKGSLPSIESVRPQLEAMIKREKKGTMLADKYKGQSLEAIAASAGQTVKTDDSVHLVGGVTEIANEMKVVGAAFDKALLNKVSPGIPGEQGVYFINVRSQTPGTVMKDNPLVEMQRAQMTMQIANQAQNMIPYVLKKKAKIEDNRGNFY